MKEIKSGKLISFVFYMIILIFVIVQSYPVVWVILSSFKSGEDLAGTVPYALPTAFYLGNYEKALFSSKLVRYFLNSTVVAAITLIGIIVFGAPTAYAISKIKFKQSKNLLAFFLIGMMVPIFSCLIPMFQIYNNLGLRNTYLSLILPQVGFGLPMCIYLYTGFMKFVPNELMEAAAIDGAGHWTTFLKIMLPMAKNSTVTIIIYNFVSIWNEFTYANTFMTKVNMKTLPIGLNDFVGEMGRRDWGATFATIVIAIVPTMIIYFILNKQVMEGMAAGAVKN
ncbi:carbohydrate ABC transporter permease [Anaerobium acetethylicum]|uniref:Raffinose/stachyose/melibiose transport system permease protein n=1 Tax=Anaerobium acetethylicum TaxID=1619234 RepID=A0A1D3TZ63_9FIRM|nr:carbohydrate ABC transporter permease [Anaerobium acetethylicum]SCP99827.1 raffinose/stachyose/melibiose transport system permease protein [Anaerobium acetethylicum]